MATARPAALFLACAVASLAVSGCPTRSPPPLAQGTDAAIPPVPSADAGIPPARSSAAILLIGDGMGKGQLAASAYYRSGTPDGLHIFDLPHHGELATASSSGITDSAASGTALATGVPTFNGRVGIDRDGNEVRSLVELAHEHGWAAGVVTTTEITHATPAAFTAHVSSRYEALAIADQQALQTRAEVMLGGGASYYLPAGPSSMRDDDGLLAPLQVVGYQVATTSEELASADPARGGRLIGLFADHHMTYTLDRTPDSTQPTLAEMTRAALAFLEQSPTGFFLMVEGGRIDHASHSNDLERAVGETIAFDEAVQSVVDWAGDREDVTILVTADHETGGLEIVEPSVAGEYPTVSWRTGSHTSDRVPVFGSGPGSELVQGEVRDHRWIHEILRARIERTAPSPPPRVAIPNGDLRELRHVPTTQVVDSGFGVGFEQIDSLHLDADQYGLAIGVSGLFESNHNALVILIDGDFGSSTGPARLTGTLSDHDGLADSILSSLAVDASGIDGFGIDLALVVFGGAEPTLLESSDRAGLRGVHPPFGTADNLSWLSAPIIFSEGTKTSEQALPPRPYEGFETLIPWYRLYPDLSDAVPQGATIALAAFLVSDDGSYMSNQALPPFPAGTENPGRTEISLPAVVVFPIDADGDWIADGDTAPHLVTP